MRLSIDCEPTPTGWTLRYAATGAAIALAERELTRSGDAGEGFPLPPATEAARWDGKPYADLCGAASPKIIADTLEAIITGDATPDTSARFGNYLTAILLGEHLDELRKLPNGEAVELYIRIRATDGAVQRLPWELMYGGAQPLAADPQQTIAITRIVTAGGDRAATTPMALPLRVLFVVGQMLDGAIRPGAEYMALLRRVAGTSDNDVRVTNINSRLLLRATPEELARAVDEFAPAVVHFICHGDYDGEQATLMLTKSENGQKTNAELPVTADALLELLHGELHEGRRDAKLPTVVVLNACHTAAAGADRKNAYRGFAANLVAGGVPVVVGMAGEVADGACRIFTSEFYRALLNGKSVALATARGRRAALLEYQGYQHTIEWARPSLFVASEEESTLPVDMQRAGLAEAATKYLKLARRSPRALCGRFFGIEMFESLRQRLSAGTGRDFVLGFVVTDSIEKVNGHKPQYGKTRMLEELAARLSLAAIAPVLVENEQLVSNARNALELTVRLADQMNITRTRFGVAQRKPTAAMKFALDELGIAWNGAEDDLSAFSKAYKELPARGGAADPEITRQLLAREFSRLVEDLTPAGITHAALLIDDLHVYEGVVQPLLDMVRDEGLGEPGRIVPLLFTYHSRDVAHGATISEFMQKKGYSVVTLGRFGPADPLQKGSGPEPLKFPDEKELPVAFQEEILAHRLFLLTRHPQPLAISAMPTDRLNVEKLYRRLCSITEGIPSRWDTDRLQEAIAIYQTDLNVLVKADDEEILKRHG